MSDRKIWGSSSSVFEYYLADLYAVRDYQPFGMSIPERSWSAEAGRFGFNGKEDDSEWQAQDYGERMYLPRQARFFSPDPLIELGQQYAELSPYQFASNRPVDGVDLDGLEAFFVNGTGFGHRNDGQFQQWNSTTMSMIAGVLGNQTYEWKAWSGKNMHNNTI